MSFDCVVIGGGAAGMMAAIQCKENNMQTVIIEHTAKLGTKILKTGNGKCNFSNTFMTKEMYQNNNADYAMEIINRFNVDDTIHFFEDLSVYKKERNGYLYPRSEMAASVALALTGKIQALDIPVFFETSVKRIDRAGSEYVLQLEGAKTNTIKTKTVILACGSAASPSSGSDGSGYKLVKKLGIKVVKPLPALTALESDKKNMKECVQNTRSSLMNRGQPLKKWKNLGTPFFWKKKIKKNCFPLEVSWDIWIRRCRREHCCCIWSSWSFLFPGCVARYGKNAGLVQHLG